MIAPGREPVYTTQAPYFRLGRIATKRLISRDVAVGGQVTPLSGREFRPVAFPGRALGLEFYVAEEGKSMRAQFRLRVVAGATSTRLTLTA